MTRALIATIHVGAKALGLDAETRHDLQLLVTGKASLTAMSESELLAVVEALKKRGFKPGFKGGEKGRRAPAKRGDLRLAHALWGKLQRAGAARGKGAAGLNTFVRERFAAAWGAVPLDIDLIQDARQIATINEALKAMCRRAGLGD